MPSRMLTHQFRFAQLVGQLLVWVYGHPGWTMTFGDANRPDNLGHQKQSYHYVRLAIDLNLFIDGRWMAGACPEWDEIGAFWLSLDPLATWGGAFTGSQGDLNHFSYGEGKVEPMTVRV